MNHKIAVILVNYNGYQDTEECIRSLYQSLVPVDTIVVDNGSRIREGAFLKESFPDIILIESKCNLGFAGGNNLGIRYALEHGYDAVMLLNNDTVIAPDMIGYLAVEAGEDKAALPLMYYYDEPDRIWYAGGKVDRKRGLVSHGYFNQSERELNSPLVTSECSFATGCCMLIPKGVLERVGELEEAYFMYAEDLDYSIRLSVHQIKIVFVPDAKLWHKVSRSAGGEESDFSVYYNTRNHFSILKKYKNYFGKGAYGFLLTYRILQMLKNLLQGGKKYKPFYKGLKDQHRGMMGKCEEITGK